MSAHGSGFDIFEELGRLLLASYELAVPEEVRRELATIAKGRGRAGTAARVALNLSEGFRTIRAGTCDADQSILKLAAEIGDRAVVCTNDVELKNILKSRGTRVIGVRDYSHLGFL
jgi:rRNA-processing protein FCF1